MFINIKALGIIIITFVILFISNTTYKCRGDNMNEKPKYCYQCKYYVKRSEDKGRCEKLSYNFIPLEVGCDYGKMKED